MDYSTIAETLAQVRPSSQADALTLYKALEQVRDGRKKRGVRYRLALILTLIVLAKLAGETSLSGVAQWVRERKEYLAQALQLPSNSPVSSSISSPTKKPKSAVGRNRVGCSLRTDARSMPMSPWMARPCEERCVMKQPSKDPCICFLCMRRAPGSCWLSISF